MFFAFCYSFVNLSHTADPTPVTQDETRAAWLRILLHLMGDMHQPLHNAGSACLRFYLLLKTLSLTLTCCVAVCAWPPWANLPNGDSGGNAIRITGGFVLIFLFFFFFFVRNCISLTTPFQAAPTRPTCTPSGTAAPGGSRSRRWPA